MGVVLVTKDEEFAVMLVIQYVAYLRPSELCNLTAGQLVRPLEGSGASSWALLLTPQELKVSKTAELDESVLLDGHLSVALGKVDTKLATRQRHPSGANLRHGTLWTLPNGTRPRE